SLQHPDRQHHQGDRSVMISTIRPEYVESFPKSMQDGVLYISRSFRTACHRCCCGCGTKIVTPLRPTEYRLTDIGGRISMHPSIGNWSHPCRAHYVIRNGQVFKARDMSSAEIDEGRAYDEAEKRTYYSHPAQRRSRRFWSWLKNWLR